MNINKLIEKVLSEDKKPFAGIADGYVYFVKIEALERNDFSTAPFGRQIDDLKRVDEWKKTAKSAYVSLKSNPNAWKSAVLNEIAALQAKEWYVRFKRPSKFYSDDSIEIFYKK